MNFENEKYQKLKSLFLNKKFEKLEFSIVNSLIYADSDHALASMYIQKIKQDVILIDPPYNENKSSGKYQDLWKGHSNRFPWAGESHGAYLDFLYPKLVLSREILNEQGLIMICIGDSEYPYIRIVMNQIFGESNYVGTVIWESNSNQQKSKIIDRNHEYVMIYSKEIKEFSKIGLNQTNLNSYNNKLFLYAQSLKENGSPWSKNQLEYIEYFNKIKKEHAEKSKKGENEYLSGLKYILPKTYVPFTLSDPGAPDSKNRPKTRLIHPETKKLCGIPRGGKGWALSQEYLDQIQNSKNIYKLHDGKILIQEDHPTSPDIKGIVLGPDETSMPTSCRIFSQRTDKKVMKTTGWVYKGDKKQGIDPKKGFETVKPMDFLCELLMNYPKNNIKTLDFFAGSGTLAIATEMANKKDNGTRSWALVELNKDTLEQVLKPKLDYFKINEYSEISPKKELDIISNLSDEEISLLLDIFY